MSYANPRRLAVVMACAMLLAQGTHVSAQNNNNQQSSTQNLTSAPELPDIPSYSGKNSKFKYGTVEPNAKGGPVYVVRIEAREPMNQIVDWYDNVFRMYKWKHERFDNYIKATHPQGHFCIVSVNGAPEETGSRTIITIKYHLIQR